jgi:hypothetical protein
MRDKDTKNLSDAYGMVEEGTIRNLAAAAAMGLGSLHAQSVPDQDRANPHASTDMVASQPQAQSTPNPEQSNWHKATQAYKKAMSIKRVEKVDPATLNDIALDAETAKRYAEYIILMGQRVPEVISKATRGEVERAANSAELN